MRMIGHQRDREIGTDKSRHQRAKCNQAGNCGAERGSRADQHQLHILTRRTIKRHHRLNQ